jgi:hydroxymethylglutaryl-CoA lyase
MKIIECPRDAMQGLHHFVKTEDKVKYINLLLQIGFDTIDFGSFVSPTVIPQMKDTAEVLKLLDLSKSKSKLLAIVANERGATDALEFDAIDYLGFPFSISETFQQRNTKKSIDESLAHVDRIHSHCEKKGKELVVYLSMAFGNPYGELWSPDIAARWSERLIKDIGIKTLALSDTIGVSKPDNIAPLFSLLLSEFPEVEIGAHLHTSPDLWKEKVEAAWNAGCRRFDGALKGFGGCPMAEDELVGNMPSENLILFADEKEVNLNLDSEKLNEAMRMASKLMG